MVLQLSSLGRLKEKEMVHSLETIKRLHEEREKERLMRFLWKEPAVPRHVVQMLIVDEQDRALIMHRSENVRSARNVWSIPTGEHEVGETIMETARRELAEEYGLELIPGSHIRSLFQYENIAGDEGQAEQYHWVITVYLVRVNDVTKAINREPDKHDKMEFTKLTTILDDPRWKDEHKFHESLDSLFVPMLQEYL